MKEQEIEDYIYNELPIDDQKIALDFVQFLKDNELIFIKDNGYWKNKIYYLIKYNNRCVCFITIKDPDEQQNRWTVWSDDMGSKWIEEYPIDKKLVDIAWNHVDLCGNCGSCAGGRQKIIFGKAFDKVCGCTFRFDNPDVEELEFMKKMVEIRKQEIDFSIIGN